MRPRAKKPKAKTQSSGSSPHDEATAYAKAVVAGQIVAGPHVRAACTRHLRDLKDGKARGLVWSVEQSERVIAYFREVLTVDVEEKDDYGQVESRAVPFVLQPWQAFIVGSLFGWRTKDGFRRFRRAYVEIGKGNGKSPIAAGIGHYMLTATGKIRAEIYSAATDKDQAAILFRDAVSMWDRSKNLKRRLIASGINPVWQLTDVTKASFFKPISSEKKGKSGIRPYCALIDEVHEHPDNSVIEMMRAGTKGNQDALLFEITNSGFDRKSVCWQEHEYSLRILNAIEGSTETDPWFAYVAALDEDDDPFEDEACWIKANPNLGVSVQAQYIREQVNEAKGMPSKEGLVRRLNFCQWTESENSAIPRKIWVACRAPEPLDPQELCEKYGRPFGGLDLSRTRDLTAFTLSWLVENRVDQWRFASKTWFWTPADTIRERAKADRAPYDVWAKQGHMEAVPGPRIKYSWVANALIGLCTEFDPALIGCDQYGLEQLQQEVDELGASLPCVVHPQGFNRRKVGEKEKGEIETGAEDIALWMPDSINKLEASLLEQRILIDPNPAMDACAMSVVYEQNRTGHRMFAKDKATARIDGMVSLAMSIGVATTAVEVRPTTSPWDDPSYSLVAP